MCKKFWQNQRITVKFTAVEKSETSTGLQQAVFVQSVTEEQSYSQILHEM